MPAHIIAESRSVNMPPQKIQELQKQLVTENRDALFKSVRTGMSRGATIGILGYAAFAQPNSVYMDGLFDRSVSTMQPQIVHKISAQKVH